MSQEQASVVANGVVHDLPNPPGRKVVGRPWPKGVSGNPAGRPDGALSRKTIHVRQLLDAEAVIAKLIELALAGDVAAIKIVMDRISPVPRDRPIAVALPEIHNAENAMTASAAFGVAGADPASPC